ncbi:hypothetical protein AB4549_10300 [Vibrio breoganii]|uniref:hypothetical protein n=1 Tax=Vibrio breoganii TaxID=553239 RepID=UPI000377F8CC|nr:hypothetical protein [Vibrio breoganii]OEF86367.1 hypothetical protein B003_05000 [Vibrio breoganii 1C10]
MITKYPWEDQLYVFRKEAAKILRRATGTLANWGTQGRGPKFVKIEGQACYPTAELREYLKKHGLY